MKKVIKFILEIPGPSIYLLFNIFFMYAFFVIFVIPGIAFDWYKDQSDLSIVEYYKKQFPIEKELWFR